MSHLKWAIIIVMTTMTSMVIASENEMKSESISVDIGNRHQIESSVLNETRELLIHLPDGYNESKENYPIIYVLDGESHFQHSVAAAKMLQRYGTMPKSIIVAIPNNTGQRNRDVSSGRNDFVKFIAEEVLNYVDDNYRTTALKTIFGHSSMGFVVLELFATKNGLFDNFIAASPAIDLTDTALLQQIKTLFNKENVAEKSLYFTVTDKNSEQPGFTDGVINLAEFIKQNAPVGFAWYYQFIPDQIHMTTPYLTMYKGLSKVFGDFPSPRFASFKEYQGQGGMKRLEAFFAKRAIKYMTSADVPERTVRRIGFAIMDDEPAKAVEILLANSKIHPDAPWAFFALARAYDNINSKQDALQNYQKAFALAEQQSANGVDFLKRQLERFKKISE